jgi:hypothetical protein
VRRAAAALLAAVLVSGCGTPPPDLFEVRRSGPDPNANVTVVVNDGGSVKCNGASHPLDAKDLLRARQLLRDLEPQAQLHLELPPGPRSELSAFTKDVTEDVCGLNR